MLEMKMEVVGITFPPRRSIRSPLARHVTPVLRIYSGRLIKGNEIKLIMAPEREGLPALIESTAL